jgi:isocitrate/isopropylmalate dehydrogenase
MSGDIPSDFAAGLVGGTGTVPSGDIGDHDTLSQLAHGPAHGIADTGQANPVATLLSGAMLLAGSGNARANAASPRLRTR